MTAIMNRRHFLNHSLLAAAAAGTASALEPADPAPVAPPPVIKNRIGVST